MRFFFKIVIVVFPVNVYFQENWLFTAIIENFATNAICRNTQVISKFHKI